jgi:hypothetical protein
MPALGPLAQSPQVLKALVQASSLRDKDALIEALEPKDGPQQPGPEEMMAQQMQMEQQAAQMQGQIELEKAQIAAQAKIASAQIAAEADKEIALYKAGLEADLNDQKAQMEARNTEQKTIFEHEAKMRAGEVTGENERQANADQKEALQVEAFQRIAEVLRDMNRPKRKIPIRDENGFIVEMREAFEEAA